jgi:hypothetical protein
MNHIKLFENFQAPIHNVTDKNQVIVGTHQYGVGFVPNESGEKLGLKSHPTSIPDGGYTIDNGDEGVQDEHQMDMEDGAKVNGKWVNGYGS